MGDGMADWLAYGLEDAFSDTPEIGIVRKNKIHSGLLRYDAKSDLDWWHVARDILAQEKPNYVIMMLGVSDRQNIRERDLAQGSRQDRQGTSRTTDKPPTHKRAEQGSAASRIAIVAPEPEQRQKRQRRDRIPQRQMGGSLFASASTRRSRRSRARACRCSGSACRRSAAPNPPPTPSISTISIARAPSAPASIYIDVWDGFVDEAGKYSNFGPDYEGQMRRLRSADGVYFTKSGARKLAHYVEREVRRYMSNRVPVALPVGPVGPVPARRQNRQCGRWPGRWCR